MKQKMSKTILGTLLAALLIFSTAVPAFADTGTMTSDGITYTYDTDTKEAAVSGCDESLYGDVTIESTINVSGEEYPVTSIGSYAFNKCSSLTSIEIPDSVTSIGEGAFSYCTGLTSIEIPDSVTSIGNSAFAYCYDLTSIVIPESVTSIGEEAFLACISLTSIEIPEGVTSIGDQAFQYCYDLTSIEIPEGVTSIGDYAFFECSSLASIEIPEGVTSIGDYAFFECSSLASIEIPEGVTSIGDYVFGNCSSLTSIKIPNSVTSIGDLTFFYCSSLTSIVIPESVISIGFGAFSDCTSLTSIEIPESVTSIGNAAFFECTGLTSIVIPENVISIGEVAFYGCTSLTNIVIPESVTSIGNYAFSYCIGLSSIEIPEGVTRIGERAFENCTGLTSIVIPESVTSIGNYAFAYCDGLTDIYIPVNASLGTDLFEGTDQPINVWYYEVLKGAEESADGKTHVAITALKDKNGADITEAKVIEHDDMGDGYVIDEVIPTNLSVNHNTLTKTDAKAPTCTEDGNIAYWTCDVCGKLFSDKDGTKEITIEDTVDKATGHSYGEPVWSWSKDGKTASATFTCQNDNSHQTTETAAMTSAVKTPATCTENGVTTYTATVAFNGETYTATKDVTDIPATGHNYGEPVWSWSKDGKTCTVTFTCANNESHKESPEVTVISAVKTPATCTENGVTTYTATVVFNGVTYTDTKEVADIPLIAHSYDNGKCTVCGAVDPNYVVPTEDTTTKTETTDTTAKDTSTKSPATGNDTALLFAVVGAGVMAFAVTLISKKKKETA